MHIDLPSWSILYALDLEKTVPLSECFRESSDQHSCISEQSALPVCTVPGPSIAPATSQLALPTDFTCNYNAGRNTVFSHAHEHNGDTVVTHNGLLQQTHYSGTYCHKDTIHLLQQTH